MMFAYFYLLHTENPILSSLLFLSGGLLLVWFPFGSISHMFWPRNYVTIVIFSIDFGWVHLFSVGILSSVGGAPALPFRSDLHFQQLTLMNQLHLVSFLALNFPKSYALLVRIICWLFCAWSFSYHSHSALFSHILSTIWALTLQVKMSSLSYIVFVSGGDPHPFFFF